MNKFKTWLEPASHKLIAVVLVIAVVVAGFFGIKALTSPRKESLVFKDSIIFEYGEELSNTELLDRIIDKEKSSYTSLSIDENQFDTSIITRKKEDKKPAPEFEIEIILDNNPIKKKIQYEVIDTQSPVINVFDETTQTGSALKLDDIYTAEDPVDGKLSLEFSGEVNWDKEGEYPMAASATDKNGNTSEKSFIITVTKKIVLATIQPEKEDWVVEYTDNNLKELTIITGNTQSTAKRLVFVIKSKSNVGNSPVGLIGIPCSDSGVAFDYEPVGEFTYKQKAKENVGEDRLMDYLEKDLFYFVIKDNKLKVIPNTQNLSIQEMDALDMSDGLPVVSEVNCR